MPPGNKPKFALEKSTGKPVAVSNDGGKTWQKLGADGSLDLGVAPVPKAPIEATKAPADVAPGKPLLDSLGDAVAAVKRELGLGDDTESDAVAREIAAADADANNSRSDTASEPAKMGILDAMGNALQDTYSFGLGSNAYGLGGLLARAADDSAPGIPRTYGGGGEDLYKTMVDADRANVDKAYEDQPLAAYGSSIIGGAPLGVLPGAVAPKLFAAAPRAATLVPRMGQAVLEGGKIGGLFGGMSALGHTDTQQDLSAAENAMKLAGNTASGTIQGATLGGLISPAMEGLTIGGEKMWETRQRDFPMVRDAARAGAEPSLVNKGAIKPGKGGLEEMVYRDEGPGSTPEGLAVRDMKQAVDEGLKQRVSPTVEDMLLSGASPTSIEAQRLAVKVRDLGTAKTAANKAASKADFDAAHAAESGKRLQLDDVADLAAQESKKYAQPGGKQPDVDDVFQRQSLLDEAAGVDAKAQSLVDDWLNVSGEDAANAKGAADEAAGALRKQAESIDAEPKALELPFAPTAMLRKFESQVRNGEIDAERLTEMLRLIQSKRSAAKAAKSPMDKDLAKLESFLIKQQETAFPETAAARKQADVQAKTREAEKGALGLGKESYGDTPFGAEVQTIIGKLLVDEKAPTTADINKALQSLVLSSDDRKDLVDAINHVRKTAQLEREGYMLDDEGIGHRARAEISQEAERAGTMARGTKGFLSTRRGEDMKVGLLFKNSMVHAVAKRLANLKRIRAGEVAGTAGNREPMFKQESEEQ